MFGLDSNRRLHDCDYEQRFEVCRNRAIVHFGVVWQCPQCHAFWYREVEYISGISIVFLGDDTSTWRRMNPAQVRKLRKLVLKKGMTKQLKIAARMKYSPPRYLGDTFEPSQKDDIEKYNQDPKTWLFD